MSTIAQLADVWPPQAGGVRSCGEFCIYTQDGLLRRVFSVGSDIALIYECNRKQLHSSISVKDGDLARRIVDVLKQHLGWRLDDLGRFEVR